MRYLSLFSGIEAASVAWEPLGWQPVAFAEIEPAPCAVLKAHWPHVPNLGDVTQITDEQIAALGRIDVVIGGSPCQDLSVAGKRAGLTGARSSLFHEQLRIFHAARNFCGARWLVWENVPGAFSSAAGRDFAVVVGAMAGCDITAPVDGWGNEGMACGENGLVEWCVLDAQWFGLAQRRKRVFAVLDTGDWPSRPPVLLEPESMRGNSPPRREAREGIAAALDASPGGSSGKEGRGLIHCPPVVPQAMSAKWAKGSSGPSGDEIANLVAHSLRADGFDASEDGTGRGTPLVAVPIQNALRGHGQNGLGVGGDVMFTLDRASQHAVAFDCKSSGQSGFGGGHLAVAVALRGREGGATAEMGDDCAHALRASQGGGDKPHVLTSMQVRRLTPRECERLQGFPDDHTLVIKGKKPMADGPRYKALGNSMAVPCIRWIGRQIERASA